MYNVTGGGNSEKVYRLDVGGGGTKHIPYNVIEGGKLGKTVHVQSNRRR